MTTRSFNQGSFRQAILPAAVIAAMALPGSANAFQIDTGNPDLNIRFDNTFRYNAGWRASDPKWDLIRPGVAPTGSATGPSETKFKEKGGMINNRLDILSEFDFIYKETNGFRVSAAGWYDKRYDNQTLRGHPNSAVFFPGGTYPDEVQHYYNGPSGEFLDAFIFTQFQLGAVPVDVKLGQHTIYWGETIFSLADGISAGQSYADLRKAASTPGIEAKELFKPLKQFSISAAVTPELALVGQYFFDWKPDQFPLGGTYFSPADFLTYQGSTIASPAGPIRWDGLLEQGLDRSGDWGIGAKWRPAWLDGTAGFFYREYTPKNGVGLVRNGLVAGIYADPAAPRTKLTGFSLSKQVFGVSWGMDLTYRKDASLNTRTLSNIGSLATTGGWMPIGDIYTGTFNMIAYDSKRALYDSAVLTAELAYDAIDKVTRDPILVGGIPSFNGRARCRGTAAQGGTGGRGYYGCMTGTSYGISVLFEPKWFQVWQGVDLTAPLFYTVGLHGNSSVLAVGQNEGMGSFSIGVTADVNAKYNFALKYNGTVYKRETRLGVNGGFPYSNAALGDNSDKSRVSFTAKATW